MSPRLARHVVDEQEASAVGDAGHNAFDDLVRRSDRKGDVDGNDLRAYQASNVFKGIAGGVVFVRRHDQLVVLVEIERAENGIHARGGIRHERDRRRIGSDESTQHSARLIEQRLELPHHESHRFALHLRAQRVLSRQHYLRRRAEGAVIEVRDGGVEEPVLAHER